jgi:hypothetical protein
VRPLGCSTDLPSNLLFISFQADSVRIPVFVLSVDTPSPTFLGSYPSQTAVLRAKTKHQVGSSLTNSEKAAQKEDAFILVIQNSQSLIASPRTDCACAELSGRNPVQATLRAIMAVLAGSDVHDGANINTDTNGLSPRIAMSTFQLPVLSSFDVVSYCITTDTFRVMYSYFAQDYVHRSQVLGALETVVNLKHLIQLINASIPGLQQSVEFHVAVSEARAEKVTCLMCSFLFRGVCNDCGELEPYFALLHFAGLSADWFTICRQFQW